MNRSARLGFCVLALCLVGGVACNPANPTTLQISGNMVADQKIGNSCFAKTGGTMRTAGVLDLAIAGDYPFYAQIDSLLLDTKTVSGNGVDNLRPNASTITVKTIHVTFEVSTATTSPFHAKATTLKTAWDLPVDAVIAAGVSAIVPFDLLPASIAGNDWRKRWSDFGNKKYGYTMSALAKVSAEGTMQDGTTVLSEDFQYPLTLCWGCLLSVPAPKPNGTDPVNPFQQCSTYATTADPPCFPGADDFVECGLYCKSCLVTSTVTSSTAACDTMFCPAAQ